MKISYSQILACLPFSQRGANCLLPTPYSLFILPTPDSLILLYFLLPTPYFLLPTPYSYSRLPTPTTTP